MTTNSEPDPNPIAGLSPLKRALLAIETLQARVAELERSGKEPIAIVGIGCRFPGAPNPGAFWRLLQSAGDAISEVPESRWHLSDYNSSGSSTRWGGFLEQVDQFDPEFFGISPREAHMMDPQQRLLLEVAWEALESGAQGPADLVNGKTGVFVGLASDEYSQRIFCGGDLSCLQRLLCHGDCARHRRRPNLLHAGDRGSKLRDRYRLLLFFGRSAQCLPILRAAVNAGWHWQAK